MKLGKLILAAALAATSLAVPGAAFAALGSTPDTSYLTDGTVNAVATLGTRVYLGGSFTEVGPATGGGAVVDATSGTRDSGFPRVDGGDVLAAAADGSGGWYVGGTFTAIGGTARSGLAHVTSSNTVDSFNPAPGEVHALAVSGSTVFVGTTSAVKAVSSTGTLSWTTALGAASQVNALAVLGGTVYAGGDFTTVGAASRNRLAALNSSDGTVRAWDPNADGTVFALAVSGSSVYVGGSFANVGGAARARVAAIDASSGLAAAWNPGAGAAVRALAVVGSTIYAGGDFTTFGGATRNRLASVDASSNAANAFDPNANGAVNALTVSGSSLYAGGSFTTVGGSERRRLAAFDAAGTLTTWSPRANGPVAALAAAGSKVLAGGSFRSVGGVARSNLAALDLASGTVDAAWNPNVTGGAVAALAASGSLLYLGGDFTSVSGLPRNRLAAVNANTGADAGWSPDLNATVRALALGGTRLFVGGDFTTVNGNTAQRLAAFTAASGDYDSSFTASADASVRALAVSGTTLYAGGDFTTLGGAARARLGAVSTSGAGSVDTSFIPLGLDGGVFALALTGGKVYAGGTFAFPRTRLAAFDATNGVTDAWAPGADGTVNALVPFASSIVAGGAFTTLGGAARNRLGSVPTASNAADAWNPDADAAVLGLAATSSRLLAGGSFTTVSGRAQRSFAAFTLPPPAVSTTPTVTPSGPAVGAMITCNTGSWTNEPTLTVQWLRAGSTISGATATTYTVAAADAGRLLSCRVTATNGAGSATSTSGSVTVAGGVPSNTISPALTGRAEVGATLTCSTGTWTNSPTSFAYQWLADGFTISGATRSTYVVTAAEQEDEVSCRVTASNAVGSSFEESESVTIPKEGAPASVERPAISGTHRTGSVLTCSTGTWTNEPTSYAYQWLRGGLDAAGATSVAYTVLASDASSSLACRVTATNAIGSGSAASSELAPGTTGTGGTTTTPGGPANLVRPSLGGTPFVGAPLTCSSGVWSGSPTAYGYAWLRDGLPLAAAGTRYTVVAADRGHLLSCRVTASNASGSASAPSGTIAVPAAFSARPALRVTIGGTAGNDRIRGTARNDRIGGGLGDDRIDGLAGNDILSGGKGNDVLSGGKGSDLLQGGPGDDRLLGGADDDILSGGTGDDTIEAADGVRDTIACGAGRDRVRADRKDKVAKDCERVTRSR